MFKSTDCEHHYSEGASGRRPRTVPHRRFTASDAATASVGLVGRGSSQWPHIVPQKMSVSNYPLMDTLNSAMFRLSLEDLVRSSSLVLF